MAYVSIGGWNPSNITQTFFAPGDQAGGGGGQGGDQQGQQGDGSQGGDQNRAGAGESQQGQPGQGQGGQGGQGSGQGGGKKTFTYEEDRGDWVPRHRLDEQKGKFERDLQSLRDEVKKSGQLGERLRAALDPNGGSGNPEEQRQIEETKAALLKLFPELGSLAELRQMVQGSQEAQRAQWTRHAEDMLNGLVAEAQKALGADKLDDKQVNTLKRLYRANAQECAQARQRAWEAQDQTYDWANDFIARHERGDKALLAEIVAEITGAFVEPGRRLGSQEATRRFRPVPRGERTRQLPAGGAPQIDYNDDKAFKDALVKARNGGQ